MTELAVNLATELYSLAIPIAVVFGLFNLIVTTFMRVAFGGKLWLGR